MRQEISDLCQSGLMKCSHLPANVNNIIITHIEMLEKHKSATERLLLILLILSPYLIPCLEGACTLMSQPQQYRRPL